jgi:type VI protein secretion system component VasK
MRLAIKTFTVYLRVLIVLLVVGAIGLILFKNRSYRVNVWLFGLTDASAQVNVVWVMLATAVCTLATWWIVSLGRGLVRDLREVRRERESAMAQQSTDQRVAELDFRQRRVEEQLKHTVGDGANDSADVGF